MYPRQTSQANINRSEGYKKTASGIKLAGHKAEHLFASFNGGEVIKGTGKTDVKDPIHGNCTVKAPKGGKVQMLLQTTDGTMTRWGKDHPMYLASKSQRDFYEDRHFNNEKNAEALWKTALDNVALLAKWIEDPTNFKQILTYALSNDGEIDHVVDMYKTGSTIAYVTPVDDFIQAIIDAKPVPKQTRSGLRISVSIETGNVDREGNPKRRSAFSFEVRSNATHCRGFLYKMEGSIIFPLVRKTSRCVKIHSPNQLDLLPNIL
jgi:hypothetical protein